MDFADDKIKMSGQQSKFESIKLLIKIFLSPNPRNPLNLTKTLS